MLTVYLLIPLSLHVILLLHPLVSLLLLVTYCVPATSGKVYDVTEWLDVS